MVKKMKGLTRTEVEDSRKKHGTNELQRIAGRGLIRSFFDNLSDPIIRILVIALAFEVLFTFGNCNLIEVFGILAAILISAGVSTLSEYGSEKAFEKIEAETATSRVRVIRDGETACCLKVRLRSTNPHLTVRTAVRVRCPGARADGICRTRDVFIAALWSPPARG